MSLGPDSDYPDTLAPNPGVARKHGGVAQIPPEKIGRYEVIGALGSGGFGQVYKAEDRELERLVAIKVPIRAVHDGQLELYREEARTLAQLSHPNIAPVFDVGSDENYPLFIVSKFIDGPNLSDYVRKQELSIDEAVSLTTDIAEALHYAHLTDCVHRDVKPGNIVLDKELAPYLVDFGLALREHNLGMGPRLVGTLKYMSPEQARGEGHRVDGRSDVFSLAVVLYQLLTGAMPFRAKNQGGLLEAIQICEPKPPRQVNDKISPDLEQVVLRALAKRASERFTTAKDFADRLRQAQQSQPAVAVGRLDSNVVSDSSSAIGLGGGNALEIVPKGLRSFDRFDAHFFLKLLPGPRDVNGLPDSIRFWKDKIDGLPDAEPFKVGLLYGPTGSGKSSFVKAGLLPRLDPDVHTVYVEAREEGTEESLRESLVQVTRAAERISLREILAQVRTGHVEVPGKLLIVIDQFEQWLSGHCAAGGSELEAALRQCDGVHTQALILVRDDFWMAVSRFWRRLELPLSDGENSVGIDLFTERHAGKVLCAFGRANRDLPETGALSQKAKEFVARAIEGLAEDNRVICAHLALFAQIMKGRPWTVATLETLGGTKGIGVVFLDESFGRRTSPPEQRYHQEAVRRILARLLPKGASELKGSVVSRESLAEAVGQSVDDEDFISVIRILDRKLRLITPTEQERSESSQPSEAKARYYQLTHDYLVPAIRTWLEQKERESRPGRAKIMLRERVRAWESSPENRNLLSLLECLDVMWFTRARNRTLGERALIRRSGLRHLKHLGMAAAGVLAAVLLWTFWYTANLQDQLRGAAAKNAHTIADSLKQVPLIGETRLKLMYDDEDEPPASRLNAALGLIGRSPSVVPFLHDRAISTFSTSEFATILNDLANHPAAAHDAARLFLATAQDESMGQFRQILGAVGTWHLAPRDSELRRTAWTLIDNYADSLGGAGAPLVRQLAYSLNDAAEAPELFLLILENASAAEIKTVHATLGRLGSNTWVQLARERLRDPMGRQPRKLANAAVALLIDPATSADTWEQALAIQDPAFRIWFSQAFGPSGGNVVELVSALHDAQDPEDAAFLAQCLASCEDYADSGVAPDQLEALLGELYRSGDKQLHASADWVLRRLQLAVPDIQSGTTAKSDWRINSVGQTMVSLANATDSAGKQLGRFEICATEVTNQQFQIVCGTHAAPEQPLDLPRGEVSWYEAAKFCNLLSEREGRELCYVPNSDGEYGPGMRAAANFEELSGYRLPLLPEWRFAATAGKETPWHFGNDPRLLGYFAHFGTKWVRPAGSLAPNPFGLFDVWGNVYEWCHELAPESQGEFAESGEEIVNEARRIIRGGCFDTGHPSQITADFEVFWNSADASNQQIGFRVVRSLGSEH